MGGYYWWVAYRIRAGVYEVHWQSVWMIIQKGMILEVENKLQHPNLELHASGGKQWEKDEGWSRGNTKSALWPLFATISSLLSQFWTPWVLYHGRLCVTTQCLWCPSNISYKCGHHRHSSGGMSLFVALLPESRLQKLLSVYLIS